MSRRYYAIDPDSGTIESHVRSDLDLPEHVAAMRSRGSGHDWTANPTTTQLDDYDRRLNE